MSKSFLAMGLMRRRLRGFSILNSQTQVTSTMLSSMMMRRLRGFSILNSQTQVTSTMLSMILTPTSLSSRVPFYSHKPCLSKTLSKHGPPFLLTSPSSPSQRALRFLCFNSRDNSQPNESGLEWPILRRWEVPWPWQAVPLTFIACGFRFVLAGLVKATAMSYLGIQYDELSLDEKARILFVDARPLFVLTSFLILEPKAAVALGVLYGIVNAYKPLPEDFFKYDWREPFNFQKGWLRWAGRGLAGSIIAMSLTGAAQSFLSGKAPKREMDSLVRLLPFIGSSNVSTAYMVGLTGVLAPLFEETVFRGFFMASLTKWIPTPVAVIISAAVFALAHLTPGEFPQHFVMGTVLGISYAQTHNLLTHITIHAFWNSGIILVVTFLQFQGYSIKDILQTT